MCLYIHTHVDIIQPYTYIKWFHTLYLSVYTIQTTSQIQRQLVADTTRRRMQPSQHLHLKHLQHLHTFTYYPKVNICLKLYFTLLYFSSAVQYANFARIKGGRVQTLIFCFCNFSLFAHG